MFHTRGHEEIGGIHPLPAANPFVMPSPPALSVLGELPLGALTELDIQADDAASPSAADERVGDSSIIKYEDPVLATPDAAFDMTRGHDSLPQYVSLYASSERRPADPALRVTGAGAAASGTPRTSRRSHGGGDDNTAILKAMLPNKEYVDAAGAWVQAVSSTVRTRPELEMVHSTVDEVLATLQARPGAVCAVRERIFSELYDELIREITLQCPERGLLLLRLRDETRMNLDTYAEIYRDSFAFSRRKMEAARQELDSTRSLMTTLESQSSVLTAQVRSLEADLASINRSNGYAKSIIDQEHADTLRIAKEEQKALETAISKSHKKLKDATAAAVAGSYS